MTQIHRHEIKDGTHADLAKIVTRLPFHTSQQLTALAVAKRQSVSLYLSRLIAEHVEGEEK
jgi:hypothetical protein